MADPSYIDPATGVLLDGEAWVALATAAPSSADVECSTPADGSSLDWSQFMDLVAICYWQAVTGSSADIKLLINDRTSWPGYREQRNFGYGSDMDATQYGGTFTDRDDLIVGGWPGADLGSNEFGCAVINFFDINSSKSKTALWLSAGDWDGGASTSGYCEWNVGTLSHEDPITVIDFTASGGFSAGTRIDLFGVLPRMVTV